jgi:galactonate dehydratase
MVKKVTPLKDGYLTVPESPGIGVELNESGMKKHPFRQRGGPVKLREDGSVALR